ncbi:MAG TPA: helix-turn-helix domain-containing protein [Pyrinomonadaceae bacterium]|jgi:excisionase family DNA binding protein
MIQGYVTTKQAAERLNVVPSRVRQMILDGVIKAEKIGRDNFISEGELSRLEKLDRKPGRPPKAPPRIENNDSDKKE